MTGHDAWTQGEVAYGKLFSPLCSPPISVSIAINEMPIVDGHTERSLGICYRSRTALAASVVCTCVVDRVDLFFGPGLGLESR